MKIKKFIKDLSLHNPNAIVKLHGSKYLLRVTSMDNIVYLEETEKATMALSVSKFIEKLKVLSPEAEVRFRNNNEPALFIEGFDDIVVIESEADVDIKAHIGVMFYDASINRENEASVYSELLELGIGVEKIRELYGDNEAEHMIDACLNNKITI